MENNNIVKVFELINFNRIKSYNEGYNNEINIIISDDILNYNLYNFEDIVMTYNLFNKDNKKIMKSKFYYE